MITTWRRNRSRESRCSIGPTRKPLPTPLDGYRVTADGTAVPVKLLAWDGDKCIAYEDATGRRAYTKRCYVYHVTPGDLDGFPFPAILPSLCVAFDVWDALLKHKTCGR